MSLLKVIKLINGDEIIGLVQDGRDIPPTEDGFTTDNLIFVSSPMRITATYDNMTRTHALYLSDWVPAISDEMMAIDKNQVITLGTPNVDIENHYVELITINQLSAPNSLEETSEQTKLKTMLKSHKFDDDDVQ